MERGINRQIDNPKWIHLHIGRTAQTHFRTAQDRTIEFSDTTAANSVVVRSVLPVRDFLRNRVVHQSRSMLDNVPPMIIC